MMIKIVASKKFIFSLVAIVMAIVIVSGIIICNSIRTQEIKKSIKNDMDNEMWENAFDTLIQSEFSEQEKKEYLKMITPKMKESAENDKYNDFILRDSYKETLYNNSLENEYHLHSLIIDYKNGKEKVFYQAENSAIYEKTGYSNNKWVSGTKEFCDSMIYGNGIILFEVNSLTAYSDGSSLVEEIICYKYDIKNDELQEILREKADNSEIDFTKLKDGRILIEENNKNHIYNPYLDDFDEDVDLDEEIKTTAIYSRNHIKYF